MINSKMFSEQLHIRYVKLRITIQMAQDCALPLHKGSMFRGGIGEMLLRQHCIRDRDCAACDFESECIVQRTMYSKFTEKPGYMHEGDSVGYVLECESLKTEFQAGDRMDLYLILIGKTIVYFSQYLNAIYALGNYGAGKDQARFHIIRIRNTTGEDILYGQDIWMKNYRPEMLEDYVLRREAELSAAQSSGSPSEYLLRIHSPLSIKYHGEMLKEFHSDAILRSLLRRIYMLDCFENLNTEPIDANSLVLPEIISQEHRYIQVPRYSNRKQQRILLSGLVGTLRLQNVSSEVLRLLLAGEILHIGKNTSFGFGRYCVWKST